MHILIGINIYGGLEVPTAMSLLRCTAYTYEQVPDIHLSFFYTHRVWLASARRLVFWKAKRQKVDAIFFVGEDIVLREDTLVTLLNYNVPIVSGLYFGRVPPHYPMVCKFLGKDSFTAYPYEELVDGKEYDAPGHDCLLIRKSIIDQIDFRQYNQMKGMLGDDISFGLWLRERNIPIILSTKATCGHVSQDKRVIKLNDYIDFMNKVKNQKYKTTEEFDEHWYKEGEQDANTH